MGVTIRRCQFPHIADDDVNNNAISTQNKTLSRQKPGKAWSSILILYFWLNSNLIILWIEFRPFSTKIISKYSIFWYL